jgi:hypothetical protein
MTRHGLNLPLSLQAGEGVNSVIVEPARSAMLRWVAGGMTRSSVPITAQLGMVFQAADCVGALLAPSVTGRWLAAISQRSASGRSCAKDSWTVAGFRNALASPSGAPGYPAISKTTLGSGMSNAEPEPPRIPKTVSPTSGMNASTYTSALTSPPAAPALVITTPP